MDGRALQPMGHPSSLARALRRLQEGPCCTSESGVGHISTVAPRLALLRGVPSTTKPNTGLKVHGRGEVMPENCLKAENCNKDRPGEEKALFDFHFLLVI